MKITILIFVVGLGLSVMPMNAQIEVVPERIIRGQEATIFLDKPTQKVWVLYHPESELSYLDSLMADSPLDSFSWSPQYEGIVILFTCKEMNCAAFTNKKKFHKKNKNNKNISVFYSKYSNSGILAIILTGLILFGGVGYALTNL